MSRNPQDRIFAHVDEDGDRTEIWQGSHHHPQHLHVEVGPHPSERFYVGCLDRDAVAKLRAALSEWLQPQPTSNPITAADAHRIAQEEIAEERDRNRSQAPLTAADVRELVRREVGAVMPLYLSPLAAPEGPEYCTCAKFNGRVHFAHGVDAPEPKDAGRPTAPECGVCGGPWSDSHGQPGDPCKPTELGPYSPCPDCSHSMALHLLRPEREYQGCTDADGCTCPRTWRAPEYTAPPLVKFNPHPKPVPECTCTHRLAYLHDKDGCTYSECTCTFTRVRP